ncbi:hypothetical protein PN498_02120 [Oscillatoria sp. CS-180]|uniref:hypothetical protein n=1 Tax=Oscillatoria sp. CS-180 TaxID=3021720 RepID=UPI00232D7FA3|nr:hypothetical protein [Oscillatoria sp. CS-180]MDB9524770.1 hypothetical protein [Oscillatoria sp. CS-180]
MTSKRTLLETIRDDWGENIQSHICMEIVDYIFSVPCDQLAYLTYGTFRNVTQNKYSNQELLSAIQYLYGDVMKVLEVKFEYIEDGEDYPLDKEELAKAEETGYLVHPETGKEIEDFRDKVFIYFDAQNFRQELFI